MKKLVIGILAHVDAGKTTLSERLLYLCGVIRQIGRVDHGDTFLDNYELEKERGITIFSKQAILKTEDVEVTLLDTPGHVDFSAEMERTLQVLDYAILVINGMDGVQSHTMTLWRLLERYQIPTFLFVNKMDQNGTDHDALLADLKAHLHENCVDFGKIQENDEENTLTPDQMENIAVCDETLLEKYLALGELFRFPPTIFVHNPTLDNFKNLFNLAGATGIPMSRYFLNSLIVTVLTVILNVIITIMAAYVFSKKKFKIKGALWEINQAALMFVMTAVAIPRFIIIVKLGIYNTWLAHILPLIAMPVGLFLVKQFVDGIPDALIEAAVVDGAGDITILRKVIIPLTRPALATSIVLTFQAVWNNVESSNNYITNETLRTLNYYVNSISVNNVVAAAGISAAASMILFVPNLIIFICMQSQVMNTMSHSGIK